MLYYYPSMTVTDMAALILSIGFLVRGVSRGFMHSLTGPFSIIVTTTLSVIYYQNTKDIIVSLGLGLIGPLLLNSFLKFLLKKWARATNTEIRPNFLSRLGGAFLTLIWGWVFIIFTLILLTVLPPWSETLTAIHNDVVKSNSYLMAEPWEKILFAASKHPVPTAAVDASSNDAKSLAQDPRFQKILQDPEIQKDIDAHDIVKLMSNPKMRDLVQQLMNDPATMKKVLAVYQSQVAPTKNP